MTTDNREAVAEAMRRLGSAWRGDWSDFDGRTLRAQLDELAAQLSDPKPFDVEWWSYLSGICAVVGTWAEHCQERGEGVARMSCDHLVAFRESRSKASPDA